MNVRRLLRSAPSPWRFAVVERESVSRPVFIFFLSFSSFSFYFTSGCSCCLFFSFTLLKISNFPAILLKVKWEKKIYIVHSFLFHFRLIVCYKIPPIFCFVFLVSFERLEISKKKIRNKKLIVSKFYRSFQTVFVDVCWCVWLLARLLVCRFVCEKV